MVVKSLWVSYELTVNCGVTYLATLDLNEDENKYFQQKIDEVWKHKTQPHELWAIKMFPNTNEIILALATEEQKYLTKYQKLYKVITHDIPMIQDEKIQSILLDMERFIPAPMIPLSSELTHTEIPDYIPAFKKLYPYLPISGIRIKNSNAESCHSKLGIIANQKLESRFLLYYSEYFYGYMTTYQNKN